MKKKTFLLSAICLLFIVCFALTGCGKKDNDSNQPLPQEYSIEFIVDNQIYSTIKSKGNETITLPTNPIKDKLIFVGWFFDFNIWQQEFTSDYYKNTPLTNNIKVYAKWNTKNNDTQATFNGFTKIDESNYNISLSNNTTILNLSDIVNVNESSTWTLCTDIYANNTITSKIAPLEIGNNTYYVLVTAENEDVKLYTLTIRRRPLYLVSFNTDGGTEIMSQNVEENSLVETPQVPLKTGYTFLNWNYDLSNPITESITISANYNANTYKIKYHYDSNVIEQNVIFDNSITLKSNTTFSKNAYDLSSWNTLENGTGNIYNCSQQINEYKIANDLDLYATWTPTTYNITYHYNGGSNVDNIDTYSIETDYTLLQSNKTGYNFSSWCTDIDLKTPITNVFGQYGDLNLYAKWTAKNYIVNLNTNGGECVMSTINTTFDTTYDLPTPTRVAYNFDGWFYNSIKIENDNWIYDTTEIVAQWTPIYLTTIYNNELKITGLSEYGKTLENINIPEMIDNIPVCEIANYAMEDNNVIKYLSLPTSIKRIGRRAFYNCKNVEIINYNCESCSNTTTQAKIFGNVGSNTTGTTLNIGKSVKYIPEYLFCVDDLLNDINYNDEPNIKIVNFESDFTLESVGKYAFYNVKIERVNIDNISNWTKIDFDNSSANPASYSSSLYVNSVEITEASDIILDNSITKVGNCAFYGISINSITFSDNIESIGHHAFVGSNLKSVTFENLNNWYVSISGDEEDEVLLDSTSVNVVNLTDQSKYANYYWYRK